MANRAELNIKRIEVAALAAIALIAIGEGFDLADRHADHMRAMESGGYLVLLGAILAGLTTLYGLRAPATIWRVAAGDRRVAAAFAILVVYAVAIPYLGYLLSTALAVFAFLTGLGRRSFLFGTIFAVAFAVGSAWFWKALGVILPRGIIPWP